MPKFVLLKKLKIMYTLSFENFIEESWDYVSEHIVSDDYWEANQDFINQLTHDLYKQYRKGLVKADDGFIVETLTPKVCGRILESFFVALKKYKV